MSISSNNKIEDILREYTKTIIPKRAASDDNVKSAETKAVTDSVTISDEGKKKIRERFQDDAINYLRTKY